MKSSNLTSLGSIVLFENMYSMVSILALPSPLLSVSPNKALGTLNICNTFFSVTSFNSFKLISEIESPILVNSTSPPFKKTVFPAFLAPACSILHCLLSLSKSSLVILFLIEIIPLGVAWFLIKAFWNSDVSFSPSI